jgi:phage terminase large subunit
MDLSLLAPSERLHAKEIIERCMVDRVFFIEEVLGVKDVYEDEGGNEHLLNHNDKPIPGWVLIEKGIEDWQYDVLTELDAGETKVSIRSAVGVGKTALVSWLALHFVLFRDDVKVIVTSPSFNQLQDGIIPEVRKWAGRLPGWLREQLDITSERIVRKPEGANNFISFRTARKETPEALQGIHATHVLLLVDEASGVHETVYEAGQGTMSTEGSVAVLISNPTRVTGLFYKTHKKLRKIWRCWKVTSFDSTRVAASYPEQMAATYGLNSQQYKVRVLGEFPEGNADSVIPRMWVETAATRDIEPSYKEVKVWGVDPGRGGDPTGFCERVGRGVTELREWYDDNVMLIVGHIKVKWDALAPSQRPITIFVDVIGLGAGIVDRLEELELPVTAVNVAEFAAMKDRYVRLRAELWHEGRLFFERKDCWISQAIPEELVEKFVEELSETAFKDHSSGKLDVENKKDLKSRGVASPNMADAFLMTLAEDASIMNGVTNDSNQWGKPLNYRYRAVA